MEALHRAALRLQARAKLRFGSRLDRLPALLLLTDPVRTPDPVEIAKRLPPGSGVVYRAFGAPEAREVGLRLASVARERGLVLLVGADGWLARAVGAHGVHLPERLVHRLPALRAAWPAALLTCAAHSRSAIARAERAGAQAVLLSAVFPSESPSAGPPLGRLRFSAMVRSAGGPVYALGGVDAQTALRLKASGAAGLAAVSALME